MCFLTPVLTQLSFQSHRLLFSQTPERRFASTGSSTHNHQVMSPTWYALNACKKNTPEFGVIFCEKGAYCTFKKYQTMSVYTG